MEWSAQTPQWQPAEDIAVGELWASSGAQWLAAPGGGVPDALVRGVVGLVDHLDGHGAGIAAAVGDRGLGVLTERAAMLSMRPASSTSCGGATRLLESADGWLAVTMARDDDIELVPAWLEVESGSFGYWADIERVVARRPMAELIERAVLLGLACSAVGETIDRSPVRTLGLGAAASRPMAGLVVANLAPLWAGPLAGDILSRVGARVIKVESTARPDGARRAAPFFDVLNARSESLALDLSTAEGRSTLQRFLRGVDVVIEGSRPRALAQMGIDAIELTREGPQVWLSITGHGRREPHSMRVGFGDDAAAAGGLIDWTRGRARFLGDALADPLTGLTAAATVMDLAHAGGRWMVDIALARVASSFVSNTEAAGAGGMPRPSARRVGRPLPLGRDNATLFKEFGLETFDSDVEIDSIR